MRHVVFVAALLAAIAFGALCPVARAQAPAYPMISMPSNRPLFDLRGLPATPFYVQQYRWQLTVLPGQPPLIVLVDSYTGESFLLQPNRLEPTGYYWARLDRR